MISHIINKVKYNIEIAIRVDWEKKVESCIRTDGSIDILSLANEVRNLKSIECKDLIFSEVESESRDYFRMEIQYEEIIKIRKKFLFYFKSLFHTEIEKAKQFSLSFEFCDLIGIFNSF